jgi:hypothetical protein
MTAEFAMNRPNPQVRRRVIETLVMACVALGAWIIVLGLTLPKRYHAAHWNLAWIGFDVALLIALAATAWAAWRRRAVIVLLATVTTTLLCADAWFDITTARSADLWVSVAQAVFIEIPFAAFLMYVAIRVINFTRDTLWTDQIGNRPRSLWAVEFHHPSEMEHLSEPRNPMARGATDPTTERPPL